MNYTLNRMSKTNNEKSHAAVNEYNFDDYDTAGLVGADLQTSGDGVVTY